MLLKISQYQFFKLDRSIIHNSSLCRAELCEISPIDWSAFRLPYSYVRSFPSGRRVN